MIRRILLVSLVIACASARRGSAQRFTTLGVRDADVLAYFQKLQQAVRNNDRSAVAGLVNYPVRVNRGPKSHSLIANRTDLLKQYDQVFPATIRQGILEQQPAMLSGTAQGIAVQRGTVWLSGACDKSRPPTCRVGIGSINLPDPPKKP